MKTIRVKDGYWRAAEDAAEAFTDRNPASACKVFVGERTWPSYFVYGADYVAPPPDPAPAAGLIYKD